MRKCGKTAVGVVLIAVPIGLAIWLSVYDEFVRAVVCTLGCVASFGFGIIVISNARGDDT